MTEIADRFGMGSDKVMELLRRTCASFAKLDAHQMVAALVIMNEYKLNPLLNELYVLPTKGGLQPYVSVDGWNRIINEHPEFDGERSAVVECAEEGREKFEEWLGKHTLVANVETVPFGLQAFMRRKDRKGETGGPIEYFQDCYRPTKNHKTGKQIQGPWDKTPSRFLNHRARIQCARQVFSFARITDQHEAEDIVRMEYEIGDDGGGAGGVKGLLEEVQKSDKTEQEVVDEQAQDEGPPPECDPDTGEIIPPEDSPEFRGEAQMGATLSGKGRVRDPKGSPLEQQRSGETEDSLFGEGQGGQ